MIARWISSLNTVIPFLAAFFAGFFLSIFLFSPASRIGLDSIGSAVAYRIRSNAGIAGGATGEQPWSSPDTDALMSLNVTLGNNIEARKTVAEQIRRFRELERSMVLSLRKNVRILCWVMTMQKRTEYHEAIMNTWGRKCTLTLFMVGGGGQGEKNMSIPNARMDFDWVMKIDDDTFLIVENLQMFLMARPKDEPKFYGAPYRAHGGYNSGGPGYALSMNNVAKVVEVIKSGDGCSKSDRGYEDIEFSNCCRKVGITIADTRDTKGGFRWSPFKPQHTTNKQTVPSAYKWFWGFTAYPLKDGLDCCADDFVSFHYVSPEEMKMMEFLIYYVHPFSDRNVWA